MPARSRLDRLRSRRRLLARHLSTRARHHIREWFMPNLHACARRRDPLLWLIALCVGLAAGGGAILFRLGIGAVQLAWLGSMSERIASLAREVDWWVVLLAPAAGGLLVGLLLTHVMPGMRAEGVADVIEARAVGKGRIALRRGMISAVIAAISLGSGASAGREGPVVHLGASFAAAIGALFNLPKAGRRTLLACGAAGAVAASFNVPIAGVLFAHEVILGHYALSAFVPIVISSVTASVISRLWFGDFPGFIVPSYQITSFLEFPAFALLGLTCAVVAILFHFTIMAADWVSRHVEMPLWLRPALGGLAVGTVGLAFPEILGVGYETTDAALVQRLPLYLMLALIVVKTLATAITLASRFGGGVFSPALYVGAMTGGAFGLIAAAVFPDMASSDGLYAILGMGAVAAAVLGAPISTTMIVFELTRGLSMTIALLITVGIACAITQIFHGRSFFDWQLAVRGLFLQEGPHKHIVRTVQVRDFMRPAPAEAADEPFDLSGDRPWLTEIETLENALRKFDTSGQSQIAVIDLHDSRRIVGMISHADALAAFNAALIEANVEEHR